MPGAQQTRRPDMLSASNVTYAALGVALLAFSWPSDARAQGTCARIADGTIHDSAGEVITPGFDDWGYNYQAHFFFGDYCDASRDAASCPFEGVDLTMKWNDAWLSNKDCDGDGLLDRHTGFETFRGSGAWLLNLMHDSYELEGRQCHWFALTKMVAAPLDAELVDGVWYDDDGEEIGPAIWDDFAIVKDKLFDPCGGATPSGARIQSATWVQPV
jgi:hypothetical protein